MKFHVDVRFYNGFGGHPVLSHIGNFLIAGSPAFGDAVREIELILYLPNMERPLPTLASMWKKHELLRANLPELTYRKKKGVVEVAIASEAMVGSAWHRKDLPRLHIFKQGLAEIVAALPLLKTKLKRSDAFDLEGFLDHCETRFRQAPESEEDLAALLEDLDAVERKNRAGMSEWDKLGIDWDEFHPRARAILDDTFYWDCADDFAPHGNDTGADLLESYRDWLKKHRDGQVLRFLESLTREWGDLGEFERGILDQAHIALAFADIKLRGTCDPDAKQLAVEAIGRQRTEAGEDTTWAHRGERLRTLDVLGQKLNSFS